jgi:hypothetical protein
MTDINHRKKLAEGAEIQKALKDRIHYSELTSQQKKVHKYFIDWAARDR